MIQTKTQTSTVTNTVVATLVVVAIATAIGSVIGVAQSQYDQAQAGGAMRSVPWYQDADGDGYGNKLITTSSVSQPAGYVRNWRDCDDTNNSVIPDKIVNLRTGTEYINFQDAVDAAGDGDNIAACGITDNAGLAFGSGIELYIDGYGTSNFQQYGVSVTNGSTLWLDGVNITSCLADQGGGLYIDNSDVHFYNGQISKNSADQGGGAYLTNGSSLTVDGGIFDGNTADDRGSALYVADSWAYFYTTSAVINNYTSSVYGAIYLDYGDYAVNTDDSELWFKGMFHNNTDGDIWSSSLNYNYDTTVSVQCIVANRGACVPW